MVEARPAPDAAVRSSQRLPAGRSQVGLEGHPDAARAGPSTLELPALDHPGRSPDDGSPGHPSQVQVSEDQDLASAGLEDAGPGPRAKPGPGVCRRRDTARTGVRLATGWTTARSAERRRVSAAPPSPSTRAGTWPTGQSSHPSRSEQRLRRADRRTPHGATVLGREEIGPERGTADRRRRSSGGGASPYSSTPPRAMHLRARIVERVGAGPPGGAPFTRAAAANTCSPCVFPAAARASRRGRRRVREREPGDAVRGPPWFRSGRRLAAQDSGCSATRPLSSRR